MNMNFYTVLLYESVYCFFFYLHLQEEEEEEEGRLNCTKFSTPIK